MASAAKAPPAPPACAGSCHVPSRPPPIRAPLGGCKLLCTYSDLQTTTSVAQRGSVSAQVKSRLMLFFEDVFPFAIIRRPCARAFCVLPLLVLLGPMIWAVTRLEPQTNPQQMLPSSHPFQRFVDSNSMFLTSTEDVPVEISIVWGIDTTTPLDTKGVNRLFNPENKGTVNYVAEFALDAAAQQARLPPSHIQPVPGATAASPPQALYEACDTIEADNAVFSGDVWCWVKEFKAWRLSNGKDFPVTSNPTAAVLEWRAAVRVAGQEFTWSKDLGYAYDDAASMPVIRWTRVRASSRLNSNAFLPANELRADYFEPWEALIARLNANSTTSLGSAMQVAEGEGADNKWIYMSLQELYVFMAGSGVAVGLAIAFIVLLAATRNLIVTSLCIATIASVLCCVVGCTVLMNWQLGSNEVGYPSRRCAIRHLQLTKRSPRCRRSAS